MHYLPVTNTVFIEKETTGKPRIRPSSTNSPKKLRHRSAACKETEWEVFGAVKDITNKHWMSWNTGELQQPGLQTIHAVPASVLEAAARLETERTLKKGTPALRG